MTKSEIIARIESGDRKTLDSLSEMELAAVLDGLGRGKRRYDAGFARALASRYLKSRRGFTQGAEAALSQIAYDRATYVAVLNWCMFSLWTPANAETSSLGRFLSDPRVRSIDDFADLGFRNDVSLLTAGEGKLLRVLVKELVPKWRESDLAAMSEIVRIVGRACGYDATVGQVIGLLRKSLKSSGVASIPSWPTVFAHQLTVIGGRRPVDFHSILKDVVGTRGFDVLSFIDVGLEGSLDELTQIARKI